MRQPWDPEILVTPEIAAAAIERQFPALRPARMEPLGFGWDNAAFLVNGRYVFRFPRRHIAVPLIRTEVRYLPLLAPRLPVAVPMPRFAGAPDSGFPYPFAGYERLPGTPACRLTWTPETRAGLAWPLGRFLAALHAIPVDATSAAEAPGDTLRRADMRARLPLLRQRLARALPPQPGLGSEELAELAGQLAEAPPHTSGPCWVHGDLYACHLLVEEAGHLSGVIDWGDLHLGDPAVDLSIAFSFLPPAARPALREAYGPVPEAAWDRARFRALHYGVVLLLYGRETGDEAFRAAGEHALRGAME